MVISANTIEKFTEDFKHKNSINSLSKKYKISTDTIRKYLKKNGLKTSRRKTFKDFIDLLNTKFPNWSIKEKRNLNEYIHNSKDKIKMMCDKGHNISKSYANLKISGCRFCAKNAPITKQQIIDRMNFLNEDSFMLKNDNFEFIKAEKKFEVNCGNGHVFKTCWRTLKSFSWCKYCSRNNNIGENFFKR